MFTFKFGETVDEFFLFEIFVFTRFSGGTVSFVKLGRRHSGTLSPPFWKERE